MTRTPDYLDGASPEPRPVVQSAILRAIQVERETRRFRLSSDSVPVIVTEDDLDLGAMQADDPEPRPEHSAHFDEPDRWGPEYDQPYGTSLGPSYVEPTQSQASEAEAVVVDLDVAEVFDEESSRRTGRSRAKEVEEARLRDLQGDDLDDERDHFRGDPRIFTAKH